MADDNNLRMKFKLHNLEFELEGNEKTVKEEFQNFKSFITGELLPNINLSQSKITSSEDSVKQLEDNNVDKEVIDVEEYPDLKEIVIKDLPKSEPEWILVYAFYATKYGSNTFTRSDIKNGYINTKRKNRSRLNKLSQNTKSLIKKDFIKVHNNDEYLFTSDGIDITKKILEGKSTTKSRSNKSVIALQSKKNETKKSIKQTTYSAFKLDRSLNLRPEGKVSLSDFCYKYDCETTPKKILVIVYYFKTILELDKVNSNHIYTAFDKLNIRIPKSLYQLISDTKNKFGWIEFDTTDDISLSIEGKNTVKLDLPIKK